MSGSFLETSIESNINDYYFVSVKLLDKLLHNVLPCLVNISHKIYTFHLFILYNGLKTAMYTLKV